jgi:hypothetical protein
MDELKKTEVTFANKGSELLAQHGGNKPTVVPKLEKIIICSRFKW